jgi:hypothetical protein
MMNRFPTRRPVRFERDASPLPLPGGAIDVAMDDLRLKTALKRAVAKTDAPAYLIDAIRREIRK